MAATATAKNEHVFTTNSTSSPPPEILETATNFVDEVIKEAEEIARKKQVKTQLCKSIYLFCRKFGANEFDS